MAFHQIAVPHQDILSANYSAEVYAADLWDVHIGKGRDEYVDAKTFFEKTYLTSNLTKILDSVKDRLDGRGGGHFRSIHTPFGGGKTHTLIALYHKCAEWNVKPVVLVGTKLNPNEQTLWGMIEEQLTGKINRFKERVSHGSEELRKMLEEQDRPILILIDELLQYVVRAEGVKINNTTLAILTIAFVHELSEAVKNLDNVCVVATLPSSANEQLDDERSAKLYEMLVKVAGRTKDSITPVSDEDVPRIIRQRLFSTPDAEIRERAEGVVKDFVDYCDNEKLIPEGKHVSEYRKEFLNSYPFLPQVINVLYHRWGTIGRFQRTRGVLRLLSLVVGSLSKTDKQFISLGDFDLSNDAIRQELVGYINEPEFNGVIAKDMVGKGSGAYRVNEMVPDQFRGKTLGTRAAAAIFMYTHSGGAEINGATEAEIKRATCDRDIPAAQISGILNLFRNNLFYLTVTNDRYMFTKEANILKIKVDVMDNLKQNDIDEAEKNLIKKRIGGTRELRTILWPSNSKDIEDLAQLKLVIMKKDDQDLIHQIYDRVGESDRTYRNNVFFLVPSDAEKRQFMESLKSKIAWEKIKEDQYIRLNREQSATLSHELKKEDERLGSLINDYYSVLYIPESDGLEPSQVRPPPVTDSGIDHIMYEHLLNKEAINPVIGALTLKTKYLQDKKTIETSDLLKSMLAVPGELRPVNKSVLEKTISDGVLNGEFGLGENRNGVLVVKSFKKPVLVSFGPGELLIHESLCKEEQEEYVCSNCGYKTSDKANLETHQRSHDAKSEPPSELDQQQLDFTFNIPEGQVNNISQMLLMIESHYHILKLHVMASDGKMSKNNIDSIKETLKQIGAESDL